MCQRRRKRKEQEKALATEGHGISRKEEYKAEQEWNPAFARLTKAAGTLRQAQGPDASATEINTVTGIFINEGICITVAHASSSVSVHFRVLPWQLLFFNLNMRWAESYLRYNSLLLSINISNKFKEIKTHFSKIGVCNASKYD